MSRTPFTVAVAIQSLASYRHEYEILPLYDNLVAYRDQGAPVGGFLTSLLSGDFRTAMARADDTNVWLLPVYGAFLFNKFPSTAHGSPENVAAWLASFRKAEEVAS